MNFIEDFKKNGYFYQCTNEEKLKTISSDGNKICAYIGFDCTAKSLHVGSLLQIMILRLLQRHGHKPIVLIGGTTTKIGDPTGKDSMRKILSDEQIEENKAGIKKVLEKFLKFGPDSSDALMLDNSEWLEKFNYIEFLRNFGGHISVNKMLSMESAKQRLERQEHLSFLEFNYMLFQAIDFYHLYQKFNCVLQIGGSDQWGNIVMGVDLTHKILGKEIIGLTTPLVTTSSGKKMGKTEKGAIWLEEDMLSSYEYFQFWRNIDDNDLLKFAQYFGEYSDKEYKEFEIEVGKNINEAKKIFATHMTVKTHGNIAAQNALVTANALFEENTVTDNMPTYYLNKSDLDDGILAYKLLSLCQIVDSNKKGKDLIKGGGAQINGEKILDENLIIKLIDFKEKDYIKLTAGRKKHIIIKLQ
jgi:tyrosyl-tRNA synthetase